MVPWLQRVDTATPFDGRGTLVRELYGDALEEVMRYIELRVKEGKKKGSKGEDLVASSPDFFLRSPMGSSTGLNTPHRKKAVKQFFNLTQLPEKQQTDRTSGEKSVSVGQRSGMRMIPESKPASKERKKQSISAGATKAGGLTLDETVKLRIQHEKEMRKMLRSLTPERDSQPLFFQYKRGDPNVLDRFLVKEGILSGEQAEGLRGG